MTAREPSFVIVGRPNVGKSSLFNRLLGRRAALTCAAPGLTLDFLRERLRLEDDKTAWLVDTGGVFGEEDDWSDIGKRQAARGGEGAAGFVLVVDAKSGILPGDEDLADILRRGRAPWLLAVNKSEGFAEASACADFHRLGAPAMTATSAKSGRGLDELRAAFLAWRGDVAADDGESSSAAVAVAVIGRPNVGKSTFVNRLLSDDRMAVSERPGTTRDAVATELSHPDGTILLVDTAGMRRRRAEAEREKLAVTAARRALGKAMVAFLLFDLSAGATRQDKRIAALAEESGRALIVVGNKADLSPPAGRAEALRSAAAALAPLAAARAFSLSALSGRRFPAGQLLAAARAAAAAANSKLSTPRLNRILAELMSRQPPPRAGRIRPKLRYAHQGGVSPLRVVLHGSAVDRIDDSYRRHIAAVFARELGIVNAPIKILLRAEDNPYA